MSARQPRPAQAAKRRYFMRLAEVPTHRVNHDGGVDADFDAYDARQAAADYLRGEGRL